MALFEEALTTRLYSSRVSSVTIGWLPRNLFQPLERGKRYPAKVAALKRIEPMPCLALNGAMRRIAGPRSFLISHARTRYRERYTAPVKAIRGGY